MRLFFKEIIINFEVLFIERNKYKNVLYGRRNNLIPPAIKVILITQTKQNVFNKLKYNTCIYL